VNRLQIIYQSYTFTDDNNIHICLQWLTFMHSVCVLISCPLQSSVLSLFIRSSSCGGKPWSILSADIYSPHLDPSLLSGPHGYKPWRLLLCRGLQYQHWGEDSIHQ